MKKDKKSAAAQLVFRILAAVLFVAGIPMIVIGASRAGESALWWIMAAPGIAFVVFGFYGSAFIWIFYGSLRGRYRIVCAVGEREAVFGAGDRAAARHTGKRGAQQAHGLFFQRVPCGL